MAGGVWPGLITEARTGSNAMLIRRGTLPQAAAEKATDTGIVLYT